MTTINARTTEKEIAHLVRRVGFGGSKEEIQMKHTANREKLLREGVVSKEDYDAAVALMEEK